MRAHYDGLKRLVIEVDGIDTRERDGFRESVIIIMPPARIIQFYEKDGLLWQRDPVLHQVANRPWVTDLR